MIGSLTARIFAIFWLTLALVLMLVLMLPKLDSRQMTELLDSEQRQGLMIEQHVEAELANDPPNDLMWWRRLFRAIDKWAPPGQRLLLVTTEGRVIGAERSEMQIIRNFIGQADNADHPQKKKYGRVELVGPFSVRDGEDNYQLYLIRPASSSQSDFINLLFDRPLLLLIVTMLVSTPLLLWLAWSLAKPARKLKNAADEVAQGNLRQHPELEAGPQEFLAAGASFNQMVTALERMMTSQQRLLSDISHELRTPLTNIKSYTETLMDAAGELPPDTEKRFLGVISSEADRMTRIVKDLLTLSKLDYGRMNLTFSRFSMKDMLESVYTAMKLDAENNGHTLTLAFQGEMPVMMGDKERLEQVVVNIISNAVKYTPAGGRIDVLASRRDERHVMLRVRDNGIGIPAADMPRLFERFYRVDKARSREKGGTGLGLAIAKEMVEAHHGTIHLDSTLDVGTTVTIVLPTDLHIEDA